VLPRRVARRTARPLNPGSRADPQPLPEFSLADDEQAIGELRGTPLLVNIWASWCGPRRNEAPLLAKAHETYYDRVPFVGVDNLDERALARAFMREFGWAYPSVYDPTGAIRERPRAARPARDPVLRRGRRAGRHVDWSAHAGGAAFAPGHDSGSTSSSSHP